MRDKNRAPIPKGILWSVIVSYAVSIVLAINSLLYAKHVDTQSNQKWCQLVVPLDTAYQQAPPQSETGRKIAAALHQLKLDFECE